MTINNIPTTNILGVNVATINMKWLVDYINKNINNLSGKYICVCNVHTTVMSYEDSEFCNIENSAVLTIPDGGPLATEARKRGFKDCERTTGPSFMEEMFKTKYKHYFYGSSEETLNKLITNIKSKYQDINIVGYYSPPFRELTKQEDMEIINRINETNPDFVWVGLGAPKQEKWMFNHKDKIKGLMVGVGAGFDYFAGNIKRAPKWMQDLNLEWFYRLLQDPKRLFKRYLTTNFKYLWNVKIKNNHY